MIIYLNHFQLTQFSWNYSLETIICSKTVIAQQRILTDGQKVLFWKCCPYATLNTATVSTILKLYNTIRTDSTVFILFDQMVVD